MAKKSKKNPKSSRPLTKADKAPRMCGCGCGDLTRSHKVSFLPGHDAKLKSLLLKVERGEAPKSTLKGPARHAKLLKTGRLQMPDVKPVRRPKAAPKVEPEAEQATGTAG